MKLQISMPLIGHVYADPFVSHIYHSFSIPRYWGSTYGRQASILLSCTHRLPIVNARMKLCKEAIANKADWVLWIDDDMVLPVDGLEMLHRHEKDLVTGLCALKEDKTRHMSFFHDPKDATNYVQVPPDGRDVTKLHRIDATGFAYTLMRGEVIAKVWEKTKGLPFQYKYQTEDIYFYEQAEELGFELWCEPACKVGHTGVKTWNP